MPSSRPKARPQKKRVDKLARLTVLFLVALLQYGLAHIPLSVDLQAEKAFNPAKVTRAQQDLLLEAPLIRAGQELLLSSQCPSGEITEVRLAQAQLTDDTLRGLRQLGANPPSDSESLRYVPEGTNRPTQSSAKCTSQLEVKLADAGHPPSRLRVFQLGDLASDPNPYFELKSAGSDLVVQVSADSTTNSLADCGYKVRLEVGDWSVRISAPLPIAALAAQDSDLRFHFRSLTTSEGALSQNISLGTPPMNLGDPPGFRAQAVVVEQLALSGLGQPPATILAGHGTHDAPLVLTGLEIRPDNIQVRVSGKGRVYINGNEEAFNLFDWVKRSPIVESLLGVANTALVAWALAPFVGRRNARRSSES
jgi:hypothetical protein